MTIALTAFRSSLALTLVFFVYQTATAQIFGGGSKPSEPSTTVGDAPQMHHDPEVKQSSWPSIPLPQITMPQISMPDMSMITTPVKSGYSKVASGTKKMWEGTKEMFTFGRDNSAAQTARRTTQSEPGFWERLTSPASEKKKKDGPQTVGEWMAQPRIEH